LLLTPKEAQQKLREFISLILGVVDFLTNMILRYNIFECAVIKNDFTKLILVFSKKNINFI